VMGIARIKTPKINSETGKPIKETRYLDPLPDGGLALQKPQRYKDGELMPLYNHDAAVQADRIVIVEGERCVDELTKLGIIAVSASGGAGEGKAAKTDWSILAGKLVILWPDKDASGAAFMDVVTKILAGLKPQPTVLRVDINCLSLQNKGDVVDYVAESLRRVNHE